MSSTDSNKKRTLYTKSDDYYCVNCLHSCRAANNLKSHEDLYKEHDYCHVK